MIDMTHPLIDVFSHPSVPSLASQDLHQSVMNSCDICLCLMSCKKKTCPAERINNTCMEKMVHIQCVDLEKNVSLKS